jgi:hypothetical protein
MKEPRPIFIMQLPDKGISLDIRPISVQAKIKLKADAKEKGLKFGEYLRNEILLGLMLGRPEGKTH